ncbi:hypothetical protein LINPERPRIM_LOCUS17536 [Linum perenne]
MAGLPMMTRTTVLTPSMAFPRPQSMPSGIRTAPVWLKKSSRVSFTKLSAAQEDKYAADIKESVESAASATSKKFEEDTAKAKDLAAETKANTEGGVEAAGSKAQEVHETLKDAAGTAAEKAQKDVGGAWDAAKDTTEKIIDTLSGDK